MNPYEQTAGDPQDYRSQLVRRLTGPTNTGIAGDIVGSGAQPAVEPQTAEAPPTATAAVKPPPVAASPQYASFAGFDGSRFGQGGSKPGSKYTPDAGVYSQAIARGVDFGRGNLGNLVDFYHQNGYGNATAVGDDRIDPDGPGPMAPIDIIRSDGTRVYQNTTGNPQWEAQYGGGAAGAGGTAAAGGHTGGTFTAAPSVSPMLQSNAFSNVQQALSGLQDNSLLQRLIAQLSGGQ